MYQNFYRSSIFCVEYSKWVINGLISNVDLIREVTCCILNDDMFHFVDQIKLLKFQRQFF